MNTQVSKDDVRAFEKCFIPKEMIAKARVSRVDNSAGAEIVGRKPKQDASYNGVIFPYIWPGDGSVREYRLRRDEPDLEQQPDGTVKQKNKYLSPPGRGNLLYIYPEIDPQWLKNAKIPIVIVEGEKKTLALQRYFLSRNEEVLVVGIAGVWGWRGRVGIKENDAGRRQTVKGAIPDLDRIVWDGRKVEILYDADARENSSVNAARKLLAGVLRHREAVVRLLEMPATAETKCKGIDDLLGAFGPDYVADWLAEQRQVPIREIDTGYTDTGFLNRFCDYHEDDFYYVPEWDKWLAWDGEKWEAEHGESLFWEAARAMSLEQEGVESVNAIDPEKCAKFFSKYRSTAGLKSLTELAKRDMRFRRSGSEFDNNTWLLNCQNGTLDLQTFKLRTFNRTDYLTSQIPVNYDPDAKCEKWEKAIDKYLLSDKEAIAYLQKLLGYCLTGDTSEQKFWLWTGRGGNGKGTIVRTIKKILSSHLLKEAMGNTFYHKQNDHTAHSDHIAGLNGARMVVASEGEDMMLDEALIKRITGQDAIRASFKGKSFFEFTPQFKVIFTVNDPPIVTGVDDGIRRRVKVLNFGYKLTPDELASGDAFEKELEMELPGILAWCVRGLQLKLKDGFIEPQAVIEKSEEFKDNANALDGFIKLFCVTGPDLISKTRALYDSYVRHCEDSAEKPISETSFGKKMQMLGYSKLRRMDGVYRMGIELQTEYDKTKTVCSHCDGSGRAKINH